MTIGRHVEFLQSVELFNHLDLAELEAIAGLFEPTFVAAGDLLLKQGTPSDSFHLVITGRLRAFIETPDGVRRRGEIGRGEPVGEMGLLTGATRTSTVVAVRDSELLTLPAQKFDALIAGNPALLKKLAGSIIRRSSDEASRPQSAAPLNILVVPIDPVAAKSLDRFGSLMSHHLHRLGDSVALLTNDEIHQDLLPIERNSDRLILCSDLSDADAPNGWSQVADLVILFAGTHPIQMPSLDGKGLRALSSNGRTELVLNHPAGIEPRQTATSLLSLASAGIDIARHHHVSTDTDRGVSRVARLTTQRGLGLVLGGGGARGLAHVGVIDELLSMDVPIDAVIGTSAGAIIAGIFGAGYDRDRQVQFLVDSLSRSPMDYTIPSASLAAGKRITAICQEASGDLQLEDLWVDTTTVTTNLTQDCLSVQDTGPLWRAVRASISVPVLFPPVRIGDDLHVDGALAANVPVGPILERHPGLSVVASDVGMDRTMAAYQLSDGGVTSVRSGLKQWVPFMEPEGPSLIRLIGRMVELSTGYGDQPEPMLRIKHELNDLPLFGFDRSFETAERGREAARDAFNGAAFNSFRTRSS